MPIDAAKARSLEFDPIDVDIERGPLRFFASATGATDPIYSSLEAAEAAGHPDLPVPPTFFFSLEFEAPDPFGYVDTLGIDLRTVLHGEQSFTYYAPVHAGDSVRLQSRIDDVFSRKGGALDFLVKRTDITRDGELVAETSTVIIVRNPTEALA